MRSGLHFLLESSQLVMYPRCKLLVGWKQQPVIPRPLGRQPFVCCSAPFPIYINARFCHSIYRTECNQFSGEICVLYRELISDTTA
jgi:hypothetical protein